MSNLRHYIASQAEPAGGSDFEAKQPSPCTTIRGRRSWRHAPPQRGSGLVAGLLLVSAASACGDSESPDPAAVGGSGGSAAAGSAGRGGSSGSSTAGSGGTSGGASSAGGRAGGSGAGAGGASGSAGSQNMPELDAGTLEQDAGGAAPALDAGTSFSLISSAFEARTACAPETPEACDLFPADNTGLGGAANVSPPLTWSSPPAQTQSFAIALHDLTFAFENDPFTHWVMWNIPGNVTELPAALPRGTMPGVPGANTQQVSFNPETDNGYAGSGACGNVYEFALYALSTPSFTPESADFADSVEDALLNSDAVLAVAHLRARSNPDGPCE